MIIVKLSGGLGNQMFQYAAGFSLSKKYNTELYVDISSYILSPIHNGYELARVFGITNKIATENDLRKVLGVRANKYLFRVLHRKLFSYLRGPKFYVEPSFNFSEFPHAFKDHLLITGYFQSEKYFLGYKSLIHNIFSLNTISGKNAIFAKKINNTNSVSIHFRRGDYILNPRVERMYSTCSFEYYMNAIKIIKTKVLNPHFFIFSDDVNWVKSNFKFDGAFTIIESNSDSSSYLDMQLMSLCKHNIIANSTFSWWAAWLNKNKNKIVFYPSTWFKTRKNITKDLFPNSWIAIDDKSL